MFDATSLVSIIVPVYNAERYLRYCLDSLAQQSYRNLQIILVDDGSTDKSPQICDEFASTDQRFTVIHRKNGGIGAAQNSGLDAAAGDFIAFCDNDDIMHCSAIEALLQALSSTGADMAKGRWKQIGVSSLDQTMDMASSRLAEGHTTMINDPLKAYQSVFCKTLRFLGGPKNEARYFNEANWCRLYRRELWDGLRFVVGHYAQDIRMAGPLYARMNNVVDVDQVLYYWVQEPDSVTHSRRSPMFWHDNVVAAGENFQFTLDRGVVPYRNYFGLVSSLKDECHKAIREPSTKGNIHELIHEDTVYVRSLIRCLNLRQRLSCSLLSYLRKLENHVYDLKIHSMK
jgi:glycosyltransferase involved in cell wall biosynthesis